MKITEEQAKRVLSSIEDLFMDTSWRRQYDTPYGLPVEHVQAEKDLINAVITALEEEENGIK